MARKFAPDLTPTLTLTLTLQLLKYLVKEKGVLTDQIDVNGWQPIHVASAGHCMKAIMFLVGDCRVNIEATTAAGETAVDLAKFASLLTPSKDVVDWLLQHTPKQTRARGPGGIQAEQARVKAAEEATAETERNKALGIITQAPSHQGDAPILPSRSQAPRPQHRSPVRYVGSPPRVTYTGS